MEEGINRGDFQQSLRQGGTYKSTLSGRLTPRNSPTLRRLHSSRTPRREARAGGGFVQLFRSSRLVYWLLLITLWAYLGFYVQSRWAHGDNRDDFLNFGNKPSNGNSNSMHNERRHLTANESSLPARSEPTQSPLEVGRRLDVALAANRTKSSPRRSSSTKKNKKPAGKSRGKIRGKPKPKVEVEDNNSEEQEIDIPKTNSSYGLLVGPFGATEERILEWSPTKRSGTCDRKGDFARFVWSRRFVLIFHELSMTGAPLSMMELATELLSCGATVSAVVLSKKGGLMPELARRKIKVLEDKADFSFKTSMKADLVIAGSAVCASWIDKYMEHFPPGGSQIVWWIMENRREYFDRAKPVLNRVKMLVFLSEAQSNEWLTWCKEDHIKLRYPPAVIPLSVNDELAFVAGIPCSLNTPSFSADRMLERKRLLRESVRKEMGLTDNDMLLISLSSINPGKGQLLLLESARLAIGKDSSEDFLREKVPDSHLSNNGRLHGQALKVLIGSVGSKSNKVDYVKEMLNVLSQHANLSKSVLWTPATTHIASLYSAADAYVMNSQGIGETFGRVTIEAMAFGLPVLGTDAGGTKEIVGHNETGLLHPLGHPGTKVLVHNIQYLLNNPSARVQLGTKGRKKVEHMYLKKHMYKKFALVLSRCMR